MESKEIVLIGGAPTIGKTYLAKRLGKELKMPWISTDTIRDQMRETVTDREKFKHLFNFENRDLAYITSYLNSSTPQEIVDDTNLENAEVWNGILDFISEGSMGNRYIIEGMAITPEKAEELRLINPNVKPIFVIENNSNRIRDVIYTRGLWDAAYKYPDRLKEKELSWVVLFNSWIENECKKYNLPYINVTVDSDEYVKKAKEILQS
jgi:2-phosphoglycerate kinase